VSQIKLEEIMVLFSIPIGPVPIYTNVSLVNQLPDSAMVVNLGYVDPSQVRAALESDSEQQPSITVQPSLRFILGKESAQKLISQLQETLNLIEDPELTEE
jgi:hypothetical protein